MIQIWKPKHSAKGIRPDSVLAHGDGLPPQDWNYRTDRPGDATIVTGYGGEGFERLWLLKKSSEPGVKNSPTMKRRDYRSASGLLRESSCDSAGGRA
jgi:hypothetical protein